MDDQTLTINWSPALIVVSYIVSTAGAWVAFELIRLRTSEKGWLNWALLLLASLVTGGLAVFTMHFVGMTAFDLHGATAVPIFFSTGLTLGSLFEPIFCVCVGVYVTGTQENPSPLRFAAGGAFAALGITLMHFTAMIAMKVRLDWIPWLVALATAIAWFASTTAFVLFFRLRALWQNSIWKQLGCALIFALAVSAMHYTGMAAARYGIDPNYPPGSPALSDGTVSVNDVVNIGLAFCALCGVLLVGLLGMRFRTHYYGLGRIHKGQLTLAVVLVNSRGQILVDTAGHLPSRLVTGEFDFDKWSSPIAHPALLWLLKISTCWDKFSQLSAAIKKHGSRVATLLDDVLNTPPSVPRPKKSSQDARLPFLRLSLVQAVTALSISMSSSFDRMGLLYDTVLEARHGKVALLVDRLDNQRSEYFAAKGFRWTDPKRVGGHLAEHLGVASTAIRNIVTDIPNFVRTRRRPIRSGFHVALLSIIPKIGHFQILVPTKDRSTIPLMELSEGAFDAFRKNARRLKSYLRPLLRDMDRNTVQVNDYILASEIMAAMTRIGVGIDSSAQIPLRSLKVPTDVLTLRPKPTGDVLDFLREPGTPSSVAYRVQHDTWASSPFFDKASMGSDINLLLLTQIHTDVSKKYNPPSGFTYIDLSVFEAMHYSRCFPERFHHAIALELDAEWQNKIAPSLKNWENDEVKAGHEADADEAHRQSLASARHSIVDMYAAAGADRQRNPSQEQIPGEDSHAVIDVDQILAEGPPGDDVMPEEMDNWVPPSPPRGQAGKTKDQGIMGKLKGLYNNEGQPADLTQSTSNFSNESSSSFEPQATPVFRGHTGNTTAINSDNSFNERIEMERYLKGSGDPAGNDAKQVSRRAWQALRWIKLYLNNDTMRNHSSTALTSANPTGSATTAGTAPGAPYWNAQSLTPPPSRPHRNVPSPLSINTQAVPNPGDAYSPSTSAVDLHKALEDHNIEVQNKLVEEEDAIPSPTSTTASILPGSLTRNHRA
ncbi:uncharacterized protein EV422DRAFT_514201 [Fimicolochytrium jonesii]|uniref:uncharacterized protein n=1 Tax=Fimicolochytrium jonesii TaxID=1396493 RepID=UPI0022FE9193|nr:uncharacterized protein EV422DRAFT_514201 [Fimicolochytrium jonesii]KAI8825805.1 hypothetical protein EV422DRAFT_514201 [Fimicolochytrium jonesii]